MSTDNTAPRVVGGGAQCEARPWYNKTERCTREAGHSGWHSTSPEGHRWGDRDSSAVLPEEGATPPSDEPTTDCPPLSTFVADLDEAQRTTPRPQCAATYGMGRRCVDDAGHAGIHYAADGFDWADEPLRSLMYGDAGPAAFGAVCRYCGAGGALVSDTPNTHGFRCRDGCRKPNQPAAMVWDTRQPKPTDPPTAVAGSLRETGAGRGEASEALPGVNPPVSTYDTDSLASMLNAFAEDHPVARIGDVMREAAVRLRAASSEGGAPTEEDEDAMIREIRYDLTGDQMRPMIEADDAKLRALLRRLTRSPRAPVEDGRMTDERLFLDAAEKYANEARELRELFNDPRMGDVSSERAARFYTLASRLTRSPRAAGGANA